jgi:hypothetical protein
MFFSLNSKWLTAEYSSIILLSSILIEPFEDEDDNQNDRVKRDRGLRAPWKISEFC